MHLQSAPNKCSCRHGCCCSWGCESRRDFWSSPDTAQSLGNPPPRRLCLRCCCYYHYYFLLLRLLNSTKRTNDRPTSHKPAAYNISYSSSQLAPCHHRRTASIFVLPSGRDSHSDIITRRLSLLSWSFKRQNQRKNKNQFSIDSMSASSLLPVQFSVVPFPHQFI